MQVLYPYPATKLRSHYQRGDRQMVRAEAREDPTEAVFPD